MLQFWKKNGSRSKKRAFTDNKSSNVTINGNCEFLDSHTLSTNSNNFDLNEDLAETDDSNDKSSLLKNLNDVLQDKNALNYFVQFMEARNCSSYIHCWMEIELFKSSFEDGNGSIEQALSLFKKYVAQEAQTNIKCPEELRQEVMENICSDNRLLNCFKNVEQFLMKTMEEEFFQAFQNSDFYCKHFIDVLTSGNVVLEDILHNETALFYFLEFIEQEGGIVLMEFWIAASNFQQQISSEKDFFDGIEAQNDAVVLYDKYFSLQAYCPLGFSDQVRFQVEQNICGENGLILDCFNLPIKIVEQVLKRDYFKPFLASQLFYKYLSELINTVQSSGYSTTIQNQYSPSSECSSERSTFLAMEIDSSKPPRVNMNIDSRQLYDPDALWKRRSNRLSLGRVTELGKYETDFEPEPDRKEFKLRDVMKKFVNIEEENRKREELAWQVAEMIVKDVTRVTLNQ